MVRQRFETVIEHLRKRIPPEVTLDLGGH
jgi:hypothetical protein